MKLGEKCLLYYRYRLDRGTLRTHIAVIQLGSDYQPLGPAVPVALQAAHPRVIAFEDPRAIAWRGEIWLFHVQSASLDSGWSGATVVARINSKGEVVDYHVPAIGRNLNAAVSDGPPGVDRNWSPFVWNDELFIIYEIAPLTIYKLLPDMRTWELVCRQAWETGYKTYLSGGTPLIPWADNEYVGLFHTHEQIEDYRRMYSMGFYTLDPTRWQITRIASKPSLTAWGDLLKEIRSGKFPLLKPSKPRGDGCDLKELRSVAVAPRHLELSRGFVRRVLRRVLIRTRVVFPAGLIWDGRTSWWSRWDGTTAGAA